MPAPHARFSEVWCALGCFDSCGHLHARILFLSDRLDPRLATPSGAFPGIFTKHGLWRWSPEDGLREDSPCGIEANAAHSLTADERKQVIAWQLQNGVYTTREYAGWQSCGFV